MKQFRFLMFVDDDHPSNVYHRIILEESGLCEEAKFFQKSLEALDFLEELIADDDPNLPDVIFLDINMPYLDGWGFLKRLEALKTEAIPPIVMLSTSEYHKDINRSKQEPLVHTFFCKPLEMDRLKNLMDSLEYETK
ncbi:MAG: response regulator [Bacteroidia bacterium]